MGQGPFLLVESTLMMYSGLLCYFVSRMKCIFFKPFMKAGDEAARKVPCTAFKTGWLPSVLVQNAGSFLINEDSAVTMWVCACSLKRGACFQRHSQWRRTFKCYFMQLTAWHSAQGCWVEVVISLKCLGGCLQGMTSYTVARGTKNSSNTTDQSARITLQPLKECWSKDKTLEPFTPSFTCLFF